MRNRADAEDITQQVFMKLVTSPRDFNDTEHEKAWLITCAANACKDVLKSAAWAKAAETLKEAEALPAERDETLDAVLALPDPSRTCLYLHYYEGYSSAEIGEMLQASASAVRNWLAVGRQQLKKILGGD